MHLFSPRYLMARSQNFTWFIALYLGGKTKSLFTWTVTVVYYCREGKEIGLGKTSSNWNKLLCLRKWLQAGLVDNALLFTDHFTNLLCFENLWFVCDFSPFRHSINLCCESDMIHKLWSCKLCINCIFVILLPGTWFYSKCCQVVILWVWLKCQSKIYMTYMV